MIWQRFKNAKNTIFEKSRKVVNVPLEISLYVGLAVFGAIWKKHFRYVSKPFSAKTIEIPTGELITFPTPSPAS